MIGPEDDPLRAYEPTGVPLVDAVIAAAMAAFEHGKAVQRGDRPACAVAYDRTMQALTEVQRLWTEAGRPGMPAVARHGAPDGG
ncbi:hypothetical protein RB614_40385 [Phytohabitans sp. ZYX-F-186]|uniref:Gfo/Idh/MocA-like oxidoreductase C-terminal domain-containing protein n=1 Tax=Phytohabitans maris TaxID=3071409 RepID=A0ABU0ZUP6_9ACTN|nr:hypothetical protein [Phytohabitans sp. ZYX-F-186]MDQ7910768.1 hypothetical protein [Phytohabitans sp. ZYX-F-186]